MICECCPLSDPEDVCPEAKSKYGYETSDGRFGCRHPRNWAEKRNICDIAQCRENPCPYNGSCSQRKVWEKLKQYEETELTPEGCAEYRKFEDEIIASGKTFERLAELLKADKEGRVVVLPCKVGDTVYQIFVPQGREPVISAHTLMSVGYIVRWLDKFGKTVFLTREEAEKALEAIDE